MSEGNEVSRSIGAPDGSFPLLPPWHTEEPAMPDSAVPSDAPPLAQLGRDLEGAATLYESARRLIDRHFASGAAAGCPLNRRLENLRERLTELLEDHADMVTPLAREMAEAQRPREPARVPPR